MNLSKKKKIMLAAGTVLFLAIVCGFVAVMAIGGRREGNAQEQLSLGERYLAEMDYENAVAAFELAIELEPRNIDAYIGLARAYEGLGNMDLALEALETAREKIQELVREGEALPDSAAEVYLMLVRMYEEAGNYEEARLLLEEALSVTDSAELQEIWEAYMPEVEFSLAAGEYEEGTELRLTTNGQAVYYTLDGSDPMKEGEGTAEVVIVLQEGNWTIRAAAEGRGGTLGDVTEVEYVVTAAESTEETEPESVESTEEETEPESESTEVTEETEPESVESTEEETEPESESVEVTEETEPESVESTEEETEPESESTEATEETEPESVESTEEAQEEIVEEVGEDRRILRLNIEEALAVGTIQSTPLPEELPYIETNDDITNWANYGIRYPMRNQDIIGTITVFPMSFFGVSSTVLAEETFEIKATERDKIIEIEVPLKNRYWIDISAEGYVDMGYRYNEDEDVNLVELVRDVEYTDVVELKFFDEAGNLVEPRYLDYYYMDDKDEYIKGEKCVNGYGVGYYRVRYANGITMGVRPQVNIDSTMSEEEVNEVMSNVYPVIPDDNGIAYITLSDFDVENMY